MCTCTLHSPQELRRAPRNRFVAVSPLATAPTAEEQEEGGWRKQRVTEPGDKEGGPRVYYVVCGPLPIGIVRCSIFFFFEILRRRSLPRLDLFLEILLKFLSYLLKINKFVSRCQFVRKTFWNNKKKKGREIVLGYLIEWDGREWLKGVFHFTPFCQVIFVMERFYPVAWSVDKRFGRAAAIKITGGGVRHNFIKIFVVCTSFVVALRTVGNKTWRLAGWKTPPFRSIYDENLRYMHIAYARTYARDMNTRVHRPVKTYLRFHLSTRI